MDEKTIIPVQAYGVKMISMGLLNPGDKPLIWRGPMLHSVMQQFLRSVRWGPRLPDRGFAARHRRRAAQPHPKRGRERRGYRHHAFVVALADMRKAIEMFRQVNVEILGVVENMSYFNCPHCQGQIDVFGHGEGEHMAKVFGSRFSVKLKSILRFASAAIPENRLPLSAKMRPAARAFTPWPAT